MITLDDKIKEVKREIGLREHFYPIWIASGKLKQDTADRQLAVMRGVLETLESIKNAEG